MCNPVTIRIDDHAAMPHQVRIKYPLTLTLSHGGAREEKGKASPTVGRGEKKFVILRRLVIFYQPT